MLHHHRSHVANAVCRLIRAPKLYFVLDGGLIHDHLTFGWVIADDKDILWSGNGVLPPSLRVSTLRAEGYGGFMLHFFYQQLLQHHRLPYPVTPHLFYCDNLGLIKRGHLRVSYPDLRATDTLRPEFNVIENIYQISRNIPDHTWNHVEAHQSGPNLTWEATLNNVADELATAARQMLPPPSSVLLPATVNFTI